MGQGAEGRRKGFYSAKQVIPAIPAAPASMHSAGIFVIDPA